MNVISAHVCANWLIGQQIVEAEQGGEKRALYGKALLRGLSAQLSKEYGDGFSESALKYMRLFYLAYPMLLPPNSIRHAARELERQMNSFLFERLAKSKDKQGLLALTREGQVVTTPKDVIKEPFVLEFLNLPESHRLVESRIEEALINQLQAFLLELGSGFAFIGRQKRLTLDGDHFYPDLVFYHVKLKCYVVIDLKVGKLSHGDLGQMLLYVNFYDQEVATQGDNPTIGLVFCQSLSV